MRVKKTKHNSSLKTLVLRTRKNVDAKNLTIEPASLYEIAFEKGSLSSTAAMFKVSRPAVKDSRLFVSSARCSEELTILEDLRAQYLTATKVLEDYRRDESELEVEHKSELAVMTAVISKIKFDETQERATVVLNKSLSEQQQTTNWHVLVCRRQIYVLVADGQDQRNLRYEVTMPIVPLKGTSASAVYDGLFRSRVASDVESKIRAMLEVATVGTVVVECDGAFSNDKCLWHYFEGLGDKIVKAVDICRNHGVHNIETMMWALSFGVFFLANLYVLAKVMRMGSFFLRLIAVVESIADERIIMQRGSAPISSFNSELRSFNLDNLSYSRESEEEQLKRAVTRNLPSASPGLKSVAVRRHDQAWDKLMEALPFDWVGPMRSDSLDTAFVTSAVRGVLYKSMPAVPETGKWAKALHILLFLMNSICVHQIGVTAITRAVENSKLSVDESKDDEDDLLGEINWHQMFSKKARRARNFIVPRSNHIKIISYALVMEVISWLNGYMLSYARRFRHPCQFPMLMNLATLCFSPMQRALQYLRSLLLGTAPRVRLLWGYDRCSSYGDWVARYPQSAMFFKRLVLGMSGAVWRRLRPRGWWPLTALGDSRVPREKKVDICAARCLRLSCCCDPLTERVLREHHGLKTVTALMSWQPYFKILSESIDGTVADIEFVHARNRRRTKRAPAGNNAWAVLAAGHYLEESRINATAGQALQAWQAAVKSARQSIRPEIMESAQLTRRWRPVDLYRFELMRKPSPVDPNTGEKVKWASASGWSYIRRTFEALPSSEVARYEQASEASGLARKRIKMLAIARGECEPTVGESIMDQSSTSHDLDIHAGPCACCSRPSLTHAPIAPERILTVSSGQDMLAAKKELNKNDEMTMQKSFVTFCEGLTTSRKRYAQENWTDKVAKPIFDRGSVPEKVNRSGHCGRLCATVTPRSLLSLQKTLKESLVRYVASLGKPTLVPNKDLLFAFHIEREGVCQVVVSALVEAVGVSGPMKADQSFIKTRVLTDVPAGSTNWEGARVELCSEDYMAMQDGETRFDCAVGAFTHISLDELTAELVETFGKSPPDAICAHQLEYVMVSGCVWRVVKVVERVLQIQTRDVLASEVQRGSRSCDEAFLDMIAYRRAAEEFTTPASLHALGDDLILDLDAVATDNSPEVALVVEELKACQESDADENKDAHEASASDGESVGSEALPAEVPSEEFPDHCPPCEAMTTLRHVQDPEVVKRVLALHVDEFRGRVSYDEADGTEHYLGRLHWKWGTTLKVDCVGNQHTKCQMMIKTTGDNALAVEASCLKWLACGPTSSAEDHENLARELKTHHGMRVRVSRR